MEDESTLKALTALKGLKGLLMRPWLGLCLLNGESMDREKPRIWAENWAGKSRVWPDSRQAVQLGIASCERVSINPSRACSMTRHKG